MAFLYPFLNFLQPGILFPPLAPLKPMLLASVLLGGLALLSTRDNISTLRKQFFKHPVFLWLAMFMLVNVISVYYSGVASMLNELNYWNVYPLFVAVSLLLIRDVPSLRRYIWGVIIGSAVVVAYGLVAVAFHFPTIHGGRAGAYGMYENHNDYTYIILMIFPFVYLFLRITKSFFGKLLLVSILAASCVGVALSLSRGGILALVLEIGFIYVFTTTGAKRLAMLIIIGTLGTGAVIYQFAAREENQAGNYSAEDAKSSRLELWKAAGNAFAAHPVLGIGSRRFGEFSQDYGEISYDNRGKVTHNTFIEVAANTGLLGIVSFVLMLRGIYVAVRGAKLAPKPTDGLIEIRLATLVCLLTILFRALLDAKPHDWSFYVIATIAIAASTLKAPETSTEKVTDEQPTASRSVPSFRPAVYGRRR
jgi:putative inorganic carbon (hco3(-)) transporter